MAQLRGPMYAMDVRPICGVGDFRLGTWPTAAMWVIQEETDLNWGAVLLTPTSLGNTHGPKGEQPP